MESSSQMASFHSAERRIQAAGGDGVSVVLAHCESSKLTARHDVPTSAVTAQLL